MNGPSAPRSGALHLQNATGAQHSAKCDAKRGKRRRYHPRIVASKLSAKAIFLIVAMAGAAAAGGIAYRLIAADERNAYGTEATIEREILRTFDEMTAAAERMDADALFQFVRDNQRGALVTSGRVLMTRADALAETRRGFEGVASLKYRFGSRHITLLSPDAAIVVADVTSEGTTQDGRSFSIPFVQTVILTRDQNGWRVLHTHQSTARGSR